MVTRPNELDSKNAPRLYQCMTLGERIAAYRFLSALEIEAATTVHDMKQALNGETEDYLVPQIRHWQSVLAGHRLAKFRTGIKEGDLLDEIY